MVAPVRVQIGTRVLEFDLTDPRELYPHEETIPAHVDELVRDLARRRVQLDPILADTRSKVVLDGMHRLVALDRLGARRMLTCYVDYADAELRVERWFRLVANTSPALIKRLEHELQLRPAASAESALAEAETGPPCLACLGADSSFVSAVPTPVAADAYALLRTVDRLAGEYGADVGFDADVVPRGTQLKQSDLVIVAPPLSKEDIVQCGLRRRLLPPKSTRHVFPIRPVGVRIPLAALKQLESAAPSVLQGPTKRFQEFPAGTVYEGRTYPEPLAAFG